MFARLKIAWVSVFPQVEGIPTLVFIDREGNLITSSGREKVGHGAPETHLQGGAC